MDMVLYRLAGQPLRLPASGLDLDCFVENEELATDINAWTRLLFPERRDLRFVAKTFSWVSDAQRWVEVHEASRGLVLKVEGSREFFVTAQGEMLCKQSKELTKLEQDVILGPALVLSLALHGVWSLHASAAMFAKKVIVFLGESGQGKSTLAAYVSSASNWRLVADDILPVKQDDAGVQVLPHFPQLKLPVGAQPGTGLPENLPLERICVLMPAGAEAMPQLQLLPPSLALQMLLRHTAGTRMFTPEMLGRHLSFCSLLVGQISVYGLTYPHRKDMLPRVKELLENLC